MTVDIDTVCPLKVSDFLFGYDLLKPVDDIFATK